MGMLYQSSSAAAQTAYAVLSLAARQAELSRSIADVPGGFARKLVKGHAYWYYQYRQGDGRTLQLFVGPENAETMALMAAHADPVHRAAAEHLKTLSRSAEALGCSTAIPKHARVFRRLADHGFFRAGGVLIGTHAFLVYQNLLGVVWSGANVTMDIDFAHSGKHLSLALPSNVAADTHVAIDSLWMGFVPTVGRTTYKKADEPDFDLDFVTSKGRAGDAPIFVPAFNITLQPLPFMEFSMEDTTVAALITAQGPIVVNVPRPERYAVHKLIVSGERAQAMRTQANKDLAQAASLIDYLAENDPDALADAWNDAVSRGPGWKRRAVDGARRAVKSFDVIAAPIERLMKSAASRVAPEKLKKPGKL